MKVKGTEKERIAENQTRARRGSEDNGQTVCGSVNSSHLEMRPLTHKYTKIKKVLKGGGL